MAIQDFFIRLFTNPFFQTFSATATVLFIGIFIKWIREFIFIEKPIRKFWEEMLKTSVSIVIPSLPKYFNERPSYSGYTDQLGAAHILCLLNSFQSKKSERARIIEEKFNKYMDEENIVLIGGPIANESVKNIMKSFEFPFEFKNHVLIDKYKNKSYGKEYEGVESIPEDYAFIFKKQNPYNPQKTLIIIAGCYGYGSYAGALALTDPVILRDIDRRTETKLIGAVIKTRIYHETPQKPSLEDAFDIEV